jgi:hypothetical protein
VKHSRDPQLLFSASIGSIMPEFSPNSLPATEYWRRSLLQIPTIFGRLVYLASLRDGASGRYAHPTLSTWIGSEHADRALSLSHHQVFAEWLGSSLEDQKCDLDRYIRNGGARELVDDYRRLVPRAARDVERQLYLADVETLLELLKAEPRGVYHSQTTSRRR